MEQQTSQHTEVESLPLDFGGAPALTVSPATTGQPDPSQVLNWLQNALAPKAPSGPSVEEIARRIVREELIAAFGGLGSLIVGHYRVDSLPIETIEAQGPVKLPALQLAPTPVEAPVKRSVGRPKGSTNKPKAAVEVKKSAAKTRNGAGGSLLAAPDHPRKGQLTIGQAAHAYKIDPTELYKAIKRGELTPLEVPGSGRGIQNGKVKVLREGDVKSWLAKRN